ncbi:MAG TPA: 2-hydroxyacid dehydrogenase [Acidimicrobiales bacterium]|nr:2-hydroxyacid dehydrogenase [Acidimicrobiales bacterium]
MTNSPRLRVSLPDDSLRSVLTDLAGDVEIIEWSMTGPAPVDEMDIVVPPYLGGTKTLAQLVSVKTRLVQSQMVGYDGVAEILPPGNVYANAASVHETSTAELTLALILASQRGIPDFVRQATMGRWVPSWHQSFADRNVLLVGYGGVGKAIESRLLPFEVTVTRVALRARSDERGEIHGFESLFELLPQADIVVVAVPLTEKTTHLIDDSFLRRMRDDTLLVNVARGPVADTKALLAHASAGRIRLALDVTDPEPLPEGHPLFSLANVLISPHVGGRSSAMLPRMARLLREQIKRLQTGDEPVNVVLRS